MKRTFLALVATLMMTTTMYAQRLTDITAEARLITDKMVVELGLTNIQRNNILNLNLTYLDGINSYRDIDARGWKYRNKQIKAMLNAKQWKKFKESYYFYRPIGWKDNAYVHNIYGKYPKPDKRFGNHRRPDCDLGVSPRPTFERGKREFDNNSKEARKMRRDMRKGNRFAR